MNILHHKSWHVYNKDNIEKVRQDEAKAEEEARKKQEKVILAESEARLDLLRKRANAHLPAEQQQQTVIQHVNLFQDLRASTNDEHEADKRAEKEKQERQLTMYLDKGATKEDQPWYTRSKKSEEKYKDHYKFKSNHDKKEEQKHRKKRHSIRVLEDPLEYISKSLEKKHQKKKLERKPKDKKTSSIEELRAKRMERERAEQARARSLFLGHNPIEQQEQDALDDRKRAYNSQFNRDETFEAKQKNKRSYRH